MNNKQIVRSGYNAIAAEYLAARRLNRQHLQPIRDLASRLPTGAHVLDAGYSAGIPVTRFLCRFFRVTGVDLSQTQIRMARQLVPQAQFLCRDMTDLSFPDGSFDAIASFYAIIHVPRTEHRQLFMDFHRILKPGGLLLACMGARDVDGDNEEDDMFNVPMYWSHYDADTNIELVETCGFQLIWSRAVQDRSCPRSPSKHLLVLAHRS